MGEVLEKSTSLVMGSIAKSATWVGELSPLVAKASFSAVQVRGILRSGGLVKTTKFVLLRQKKVDFEGYISVVQIH